MGISMKKRIAIAAIAVALLSAAALVLAMQLSNATASTCANAVVSNRWFFQHGIPRAAIRKQLVSASDEKQLDTAFTTLLHEILASGKCLCWCDGCKKWHLLDASSGTCLDHCCPDCGGELETALLNQIKEHIDIASERGLNGMVLSSFQLDGITEWDDAQDLRLLEEIVRYCVSRGIEVIPSMFGIGGGGAALWNDRDFAAALPTTLRLQVIELQNPTSTHARGLVPVPGPEGNLIRNGDLEEYDASDSLLHFWQESASMKPTRVQDIKAHGHSSIRFDGFSSANLDLYGVIRQAVSVRPNRCYRLTFRIRTEGFGPASKLVAGVCAGDTAPWVTLVEVQPDVDETTDWKTVTLDFHNQSNQVVTIFMGTRAGVLSGRFWIDDIRFVEYGDLSNIVRRDGTSLSLLPLLAPDGSVMYSFAESSEDGAYTGDFDYIRCLNPGDAPEYVGVPHGSAIESLPLGEILKLSCYKASVWQRGENSRMSLCMSNPALLQFWNQQIQRVSQVLSNIGYELKHVFFDITEVRNGGGCALCQARLQSGWTMGRILGDCIGELLYYWKIAAPNVEALTWSDMLTPLQNADDNGPYFNVVGNFYESWKWIPSDLGIMCWGGRTLQSISERLEFFSDRQFETYGAPFFNKGAKDIDMERAGFWLEALAKTPGAQGIMHTCWPSSGGTYDNLADFCYLVCPMLAETFDRGAAPGWSLESGWVVVQPDEVVSLGLLSPALAGTGHCGATYPPGAEWGDYITRFLLYLQSGTIHINTRVTVTPEAGHSRYFVGIGGESVYLSKTVTFGDDEEMHTLLEEAHTGLAYGAWHEVEIVCNGGHIEVIIDDIDFIRYDDPDPLTRGTITFETLENSAVYIDDVTVTELPSSAPEAEE